MMKKTTTTRTIKSDRMKIRSNLKDIVGEFLIDK